MSDLGTTITHLFASGKGLLAADESPASADKRLAQYGIEGTEEMRRKFRDLLLGAPGIDALVSGVILQEETLSQKTNNGVLFPKLLTDAGIVPGIKVDGGTEPMQDHPEELITKGLVGLGDRLVAFHDKNGTRFTKWRAVIRIDGDRLPSSTAIVENAKRLASYACEAQRAGMVPILEPEVLLEGSHSRLRCREVMELALSTVVAQLLEQCADPSGVIIKTSMALSGKESKKQDTPEEVAKDTVEALLATVPKEIGGIVFLSGGQTPDQSIDNLRAIMRLAKERGAPWPLTFSFARTFQEEALTVWKGEDANVEVARKAYLGRLRQASEALGS